MNTIKVDKKSPSVDELLAIARREPVLLVSPDGTSFVLEEADDFDREVAELGSSKKFMSFLEKRSREKGAISIEQFADELDSTATCRCSWM
jgi:hypothetical protein